MVSSGIEVVLSSQLTFYKTVVTLIMNVYKVEWGTEDGWGRWKSYSVRYFYAADEADLRQKLGLPQGRGGYEQDPKDGALFLISGIKIETL